MEGKEKESERERRSKQMWQSSTTECVTVTDRCVCRPNSDQQIQMV